MSLATPRIADALCSSGCLSFGTFRIRSGAVSPYYIDLARLISSPRNLRDIAEVAAREVRNIQAVDRIDKLASIELKGALILPSIGCQVDLPCIVVRKEQKTYGITGRTAGAEVRRGDHILFFDDVLSDGLSKIEGIRPLEELGAKVKHLMVVVDREQKGRENLQKLGYSIHSLTRISEIVRYLRERGKVTEKQAEAVREYVQKTNGSGSPTS
jgi:uridine monophosphate synthetase